MKRNLIVFCLFWWGGSLAFAAMSNPTSEGARGYVNNYHNVNFVNRTFTNSLGQTEAVESVHIVIKDLDRPSDEVVARCNRPEGVEATSQNNLDYSQAYEHAFRAFVYVNTDMELEENLVAVFMVSPGRIGVHTENSGAKTLGSYTLAGDFNVLDHDPSILGGEKFGQFGDLSLFDLYKSKASEGAKMYEAIFFQRGTALHGSDGIVDGNPRSHGCVRFRREEAPLNLALARAARGNVKVSIRDTEVFKSCYDRDLIDRALEAARYMEQAAKQLERYNQMTPMEQVFINMGSGGLY